MATPSLGFDNFFSTTLNGAISDTDLTITLNAVPTASEGFLVLEGDNASKREVIYYTSKGASTVTCPSGAGNGRGYDGSTASSHADGAGVVMSIVAAQLEALQDFSGTDSTKGVLGTINTYTSSGTWTKPSGLKFVTIEVQGGGGGGGGSGTNNRGAGGGASGGYSRKKILVGALGATETVTVGTGGSGAAAGDNNGGVGVDTTFGSHATGSGGGYGAKVSSGGDGGDGGAASGGDLSLKGGSGQGGSFNIDTPGGQGGSSFFTGGGKGAAVTGTARPGGAAEGGGGGGGGHRVSSSAAGGDGGDGGLIVHEYF